MRIIGDVLIILMIVFQFWMSTQEGGSSSGSGSGAGTEPISEKMWEFISSEITRCILEQIL